MKACHRYILGTLLCLAALIFIENLPHESIKLSQQERISVKNLEQKIEAIYSSHPGMLAKKSGIVVILSLTILTYILLIVAGTGMIAWFIIKKSAGRPIIPQAPPAMCNINIDTGTRILFYLSFIIAALHFLLWYWQAAGRHNTYIPHALILNLVMETAVILLVLKNIPRKNLGLDKKMSLRATLQIYVATLALFVGVSQITQLLGVSKDIPKVTQIIFSLNKHNLCLAVLQIAITAPIAEELLFRGFIFKWLRRRYSFFISAGIVSLIFASLHMEAKFLPEFFLISVSLCYLYERTQNILNSIAMHAAFNTINALLLILVKNLI